METLSRHSPNWPITTLWTQKKLWRDNLQSSQPHLWRIHPIQTIPLGRINAFLDNFWTNFLFSSDADATITSISGSNPTTSLTSTPLHSSVPASPFRLMREESVDGTLSPVSFKGGMDTLDNDTTGRRKVRDKKFSFSLKSFRSLWCFKIINEMLN